MEANHKKLNIINQNLAPKLFEAIVTMNKEIPVHQILNINLRCLGAGYAELEMTAGPDLTNSYGLVHGGIITTFADSAMGVVFRTLNLRVVTLEMNINFFAPVPVDHKLIAKTWTVHVGSQIAVAEVDIFDAQAKTIAKSRATFFRIGRLLETLKNEYPLPEDKQ